MPKGVKGFARADGRRTKKEAAVLREEERVASAGGEDRCSVCLTRDLWPAQRRGQLGRVCCQGMHAAFCWPCIADLARTPSKWAGRAFVCPICRDRARYVERVGIGGDALQRLRVAARDDSERRARRAADAMRAADSRADASAAEEASAAAAHAANAAAQRELVAQVLLALGGHGAAQWLVRQLVGLVEGRPMRAAMPCDGGRLPHGLVQLLLEQVPAPAEQPRFAVALERVRHLVPPVHAVADGRRGRQRSAASAANEVPPEVHALVSALIECGALS